MKVENGVLIIEDEINDEAVEEFLITISQDRIEKIKVKTPNIGASIVQALLIKKRDTQVEIEDTTLKKIFENVHYETVD